MFAIAISFGVLARPVMGPIAPIVMSITVFSGAGQFGALAVLAAGGSAGAAIVAGVLLNARYLAMGVALAPSLRGPPQSRAVFALTTVDASWAAASRGDGTFDVERFVSSVEYVITAMDISICFADFPTQKIAETTRAYRQRKNRPSRGTRSRSKPGVRRQESGVSEEGTRGRAILLAPEALHPLTPDS